MSRAKESTGWMRGAGKINTFLTVDHKWRETSGTDPSSSMLISIDVFYLRANRLASFFSLYAISGANGQRFRQSFVSISYFQEGHYIILLFQLKVE